MSELWLNGDFVASDLVRAPALDGDRHGLFETILVRDGAPLRLERHLARLAATAWKTTGLSSPDLTTLEVVCRALPERLGMNHGCMRIALTAADLAVSLAPFAGYPAAAYAEGCVVLPAPEPGHPLGVRAGRKLLPYTPLLAARAAAQAAGATDVLFHAGDGALLEGAASNLFVVIGGRLRTPPLTRGVLPGIVRGAVIEAARAASLEVAETDVFFHDLDRADEVFLTGSLMEVLPVRQVGGRAVPPGSVAVQMLAAIRRHERPA